MNISSPLPLAAPPPQDGLAEPSADKPARASISIVMPTFNRADMMARVVRKTRDCAVGYTVEWVVVNDGSTDQTEAVLTELQKEIPNFTFRTVPNGGPGRARNVGASLAKHDVLLFIGDDI